MTYSNSSICDTYNGQCDCKQSSDGGFYGGRQCTECRWDAIGKKTFFIICIAFFCVLFSKNGGSCMFMYIGAYVYVYT